MAWSTTNLTEELNLVINNALAGGLTCAQISTALGAQKTAIDALISGTPPTHSREIQDPGSTLNPAQP